MSNSCSTAHPLMSTLMPTLSAKVKLLISETLTLNLEIAQLQQENARLKAQLTQWNVIDTESSHH
jgi:hypothetical protein